MSRSESKGMRGEQELVDGEVADGGAAMV